MRTYTFARRGVSEGDWHLLDGAPAQGVPLPLGREQPQLLLLVLGQAVAVPGEGELGDSRRKRWTHRDGGNIEIWGEKSPETQDVIDNAAMDTNEMVKCEDESVEKENVEDESVEEEKVEDECGDSPDFIVVWG